MGGTMGTTGTTARTTEESLEERRRWWRTMVEAAWSRAVSTVLSSTAAGTEATTTTTTTAATTSTAERSSGSMASRWTAFIFGRDPLGRVRGGRIRGVRSVAILFVLLFLLTIGHSGGDLLVVDVLGREILAVGGVVVLLTARAVTMTAAVSSSASASMAVSMSMAMRSPWGLGLPFLPPVAFLEATLPEFGVGEGAEITGRGRCVVDAGTQVVPVETARPSHDDCD